MTEDKRFGVAFSGGGIRSAAFCSGVLRRLITQNAEPDYLSCVSGGGYTGSAFVQWRYSKNRQSKENWTNDFFDHMRKRSGYICNWNEGCGQGCLDAFILGCLLFFVVIVIPFVVWGSFACPIALVVKLLYGKYLDGKLCRKNPDSIDCKERTGLFAATISVFIAFNILECLIKRCGWEKENHLRVKWIKAILKLIQLISGASFAFTFLPWFFKNHLDHVHLVYRIVVLGVTAFLWFFVPILRQYPSLVFFIYLYSYVVYWHLYDETLFNVKHTQERFIAALTISILIMVFPSVVGNFQLRLVHVYNRWRLQKAFYYRSENESSCSGIEYYDLFPGCYRAPTTSSEETSLITTKYAGLTLDDCKTVKKPVYISNMVVNGWRRNYREKYCHLIMSPKGIAVLGHHEDKPTSSSDHVINIEPNDSWLDDEQIRKKLKPNDVKLSSAMAMSAAAVSPYLGAMKKYERPFKHILTVFGLDMAATIVNKVKNERKGKFYSICGKVCCCFPLLALCGLVFFGTIRLALLDPAPVLSSAGGIIIIICLILLWILLCCIASCKFPFCSGWRCTANMRKSLTRCSRWLIVDLPIYRFFCYILNITSEGPDLPALLHLSDGGHYENYGILPLLKLKLPKILVADGSQIKSDEDYGKQIKHAMDLARDLLGCSFTAMDGGDVLTDIQEKFVNGKRPRKYELKVEYYERDPATNERKKCGEGTIVLIAPRPPSPEQTNVVIEDPETNERKSGQESMVLIAPRPPRPGQENEGIEEPENNKMKTWDDYKENLKESEWGKGPYLTKKDVNDIAGCPAGLGCCECCQDDCCCSFQECCSSFLAFPRHTTANQFFTPTMFATYHREGYRACMECDKFFAS